MRRTDTQLDCIESTGSTFLFGLAGTGKSTVFEGRLAHLLESEPSDSILAVVSEGAKRQGILDRLSEAYPNPLGDFSLVTFNRFARDMVAFFWPEIAAQARFAAPNRPPVWLTYDLAQILMFRVVDPLLDQGRFVDARLRPQQIVSQLIDNLNRAAQNRLFFDDAIQRQIASWPGDPQHIRQLNDALYAAKQYRQRCLDNQLVDLSLTIDLFNRYVLPHPGFEAIMARYRHVLVDNVEEQTAAGQFLIEQQLSRSETGLIIMDDGGGYKRFLAADPALAGRFESLCDRTVLFSEPFIESPAMGEISSQVSRFLVGQGDTPNLELARTGVLGIVEGRYRREMLQSIGPELAEILAREGVEPADVAIVVPYIDGALRYKLTQSLRDAGLPYQLSRRRASPREEPRVRAWLTFLVLAHPEWGLPVSLFDVSEALSLTLHGLDPARARVLAQAIFDPISIVLHDPDQLTEFQIGRIGEAYVDRYRHLYQWLSEAELAGSDQLDRFFYQLFTEVLSDPIFNPTPDYQVAAVCDWLIRLASRFQSSAAGLGITSPQEMGQAFIQSIYDGLVSASPPDLGDPPDPAGIFIGTIVGFLLSERTTKIQVWLETAATGWWDIPRQPLSNGFVLSESWQPDQLWTLEDDTRIRNELLDRMVTGLCSRCETGIVLASSELDRRGARQDGPLWRALAFATDAEPV